MKNSSRCRRRDARLVRQSVRDFSPVWPRLRALTFPQQTSTLAFLHALQEPHMTLADLATQHCLPRQGSEHALHLARIEELLALLPGWQLRQDGKAIVKDFRFADFHRTLGFINAVGFMANQEDHHPDLEAGYGHCQVLWSTHDVGGLSLNDFICAARVETLLAR
jgi:4a-hydroxytetrahydrobiopterin dehydratase